MERMSFVFYKSFSDAICDLQRSKKLEMYDAIVNYSLCGKEPELKGELARLWKLIKPQLDANYDRYKNGQKGGRPKREPVVSKNENHRFKKIKPNENVNDNVNDNENVNVNDNERVYTPPTLDMICSFCTEKELTNFDSEKFFNYYESTNWTDKNGNHISNWKAKIRYWYRQDKQKKEMDLQTPKKITASTQRQKLYDEFLED